MASRVVPEISLTSVRASPTIALVSDDFPTFGRPTIAMETGLSADLPSDASAEGAGSSRSIHATSGAI